MKALHRLLPKFLRRAKPESPVSVAHEYPLSEPKPRVLTVKRRRKVKRNYIYSKPSTDPRFNHSLRPSHVERRQSRIANNTQ